MAGNDERRLLQRRDFFECTVAQSCFAKNRIDERRWETTTFERASETRIARLRLRATELCERFDATAALAERSIGDGAPRAFRIDPTTHQLANETSIALRIARTFDVERSEKRIVEVTIGFTSHDGIGDRIVIITAALELGA